MDGSYERISETAMDLLFKRAFLTSQEFCDRVRGGLGLPGTGLASRVERQMGHSDDGGTIDLDVTISGTRLLIENKISAHWSHVDGVPQPERYVRSGHGYSAVTVLLAPRSYLRKSLKAGMFDKTLSYEALLPAFSGPDFDQLCLAIDQAVIPPENPSEVQTIFFEEFGRLMAEIAPQICEKKRPRNKRSHTIHLDVRRSLILHPGLPKPSVFLQFEQANVKLMVRKWGWHLAEIEDRGDLEGTGIRLLRVGDVGTLALQLPTPFINCKGPFAPERTRAAEAILTTAKLCSWWNANADMLRAWQKIATR